MNTCELTRLKTELEAAILADSPMVSALFAEYTKAGGKLNLSDIDKGVKKMVDDKRQPALKVKS